MFIALVFHTIVDIIYYLVLQFFHCNQYNRTHEQEDQYIQLTSYIAVTLDHH